MRVLNVYWTAGIIRYVDTDNLIQLQNVGVNFVQISNNLLSFPVKLLFA